MNFYFLFFIYSVAFGIADSAAVASRALTEAAALLIRGGQ